MKAAVSPKLLILKLESHIHQFFSAPQRKNRLEENSLRLDVTSDFVVLLVVVSTIYVLSMACNENKIY